MTLLGVNYICLLYTSDAAEKLIDLQKKMQDIEEGPKSKQKVTNNNALFVGSTAELSKLIKQGLLDNK